MVATAAFTLEVRDYISSCLTFWTSRKLRSSSQWLLENCSPFSVEEILSPLVGYKGASRMRIFYSRGRHPDTGPSKGHHRLQSLAYLRPYRSFRKCTGLLLKMDVAALAVSCCGSELTKPGWGPCGHMLTERPHVWLAAVLEVVKHLWGWPLDRKLGSYWADVLVIKNIPVGGTFTQTSSHYAAQHEKPSAGHHRLCDRLKTQSPAVSGECLSFLELLLLSVCSSAKGCLYDL